jgi:hypothetical protein
VSGSFSRTLLSAALLTLLLSAVWSLRTAPAPNSDRYDYAGRALQAVRGEGLRPLVVYPVQLAAPGGEHWPVRNVSRPPAWPAALVPLVRAGLSDRAGVVLAAICAVVLLLLLALVGDRTFGPGAGGMAALALASSFAATRALWGGGPELALSLLTYVLWTWSPRGQGRLAHLACGTLYGMLPLLHPIGWLLGLLALLARGDRYDRGAWALLGAGATLIAIPWHVHSWAVCGSPHFYVQTWAELAKSVDDPAGFGPYRGLTPASTLAVLGAEPGRVARAALHNAVQLVTHLDGWLAWPLLALALLGARESRAAALRDLVLIAAALLLLAPWTREERLLVPLLPVASTWVGAGLAGVAPRRRPRWWAWGAIAVAAAPWILPLGSTLRPGAELRGLPASVRHPPARLIQEVRDAAEPAFPFFTDSAVLAWNARRPAIFLPDRPSTLEAIRRRPGLRGVRLLALTQGPSSHWTAPAQAQWDTLTARAQAVVRLQEGGVLLHLPPVALDPAP